MTAAFFATLAVAIIVIVVLAARERSRRRVLEQVRREVTVAAEKAMEADRLHAEAEASAGERISVAAKLSAEKEATLQTKLSSVEAALSDQRTSSAGQIVALEQGQREAEAAQRRLEEAATARAAEAEAAVGAAAARIAELEAAQAAAGSPAPPRGDHDRDAGWRLLLARVERQWADVVNAGPDERGVLDGRRGEQLAQAVQRDLERLREEVGVQTTLSSSAPLSDDRALSRLLAVGEAVALLAYHSEQVVVDLRDPATVSGQDWTGGDDARRQLEQLATMATEAGLPTTVEVTDHTVHVALGTQPEFSTS